MSVPALRIMTAELQEQVAHRKRGKSRIAQHIILRGTIYYYRRMVHGQRYWESLDTGDKQTALARARIKEDAIDRGRWQDLEATRQRQTFATIADLISAYNKICARQGKVRDISRKGNVRSLLLVLREGLGIETPSQTSTRMLTGNALVALLDKRLRETNGSMAENDTARRTVASIAAKARSVVREQLDAEYAASGIKLPDLSDFRNRFLTITAKPDVDIPTTDEISNLKAEADKLPTTDIHLYPVWLLAYHCALRAGEIARCRWNWFKQINGQWWIEIIKRPEENYQPKGRPGAVPVPAACWERLQACRKPGQDYLVDGPTDNWRYDVVRRDFSLWMRAHGWTHHSTSHAIRKWRIQRWRETYDLHIARDWGRHADSAVTQDYYTHSRNASQKPMED